MVGYLLITALVWLIYYEACKARPKPRVKYPNRMARRLRRMLTNVNTPRLCPKHIAELKQGKMAVLELIKCEKCLADKRKRRYN